MTGFGRAQGSLADRGVDITVEIRTVNSRYLDYKAHLPRELLFMELDLKKIISEQLHRGRVDLFLDVQQKGEDELRLNRPLVEHLVSLSQELKETGVAGDLLIGDLFRFQGVVSSAALEWDSDAVKKKIRAITSEALSRLVQMRDAEGDALKREIAGRIRALNGIHERLVAGAGAVRDHYRMKLAERIKEVAPAEWDKNRATQEIVFLSEKADISEELARFESHLSVLSLALGNEDGEESIGKRLDFLCQELNREATTILSKSALVEVSDLALEAKAEIEKIREQVQNVE